GVAHLIRLLIGCPGQVEPADRRDRHADRQVDRLVCVCHALALMGMLHPGGHLLLQLLGVAEHAEGKLAHGAQTSASSAAYTPSRTSAGSGCGLVSASRTPASIHPRTSSSIAGHPSSEQPSTSA